MLKLDARFIGIESGEIIYIKGLLDKPHKKVVYSFEGGTKMYSLTESMFLELYRPYGKLDNYLKEVEDEDVDNGGV
jgi:hypothetical protein